MTEAEILLIDPSGVSLGSHTMVAAERIAAERFNLDLVEVRPGVFKILDVGRLNYEAGKRKVVKARPIKEMKFKLNIGDADFDTKVNHVRRFLESGSPVKVTIWFTGREVSRPEAGVSLLERIGLQVADVGTGIANQTLQGRNMQMFIDPKKK